MNSKLYKFKNVGFTFVRNYRKWTFRNDEGRGQKTLIQECPGGVNTARKVAVQVAASLKRSRQLTDGLAVAAIRNLTHPSVD